MNQMDKNDIVKVLKKVFDFVLNLEENDMEELLKEKKKLILAEKKINNVKNNNDTNISEIINKLNSFKTREQAHKFLVENKFTVKILKEVASSRSIYIRSRSNKGEIIDKIVEGTIGAVLKINILKGE